MPDIKHVTKNINTTVDTIVNNINNFKKLSAQEIKEQVMHNWITANDDEKRLYNDLFYNANEFNICYNEIIKCYEKFTKSKFYINNNQNVKEIAPLLLARCFEECSLEINHIRILLSNLNQDSIIFHDEIDKEKSSQLINNLALNEYEINNIDATFYNLQEPIIKKQSLVAQHQLIEAIKNNSPTTKSQILKLLENSIKQLKLLSNNCKDILIEFPPAFFSKKNREGISGEYWALSIYILLENARETINGLNNLSTEISKIWENQYNNIGYVPAILNDLQNIDMLLNHDVDSLENMSKGLIKTHNQHVGLVSGIEWLVHEIQKLTRLIHNNVNNIKDKLQEMLNKINNK